MKLKNVKGGFNREIAQTYTKGSSSKLLLDTVSPFAAPSLSGGGEKKFLQCLHMFEMPAKQQKHLNALLLYFQPSKLLEVTLLDLLPLSLPLLAKETLFDLEVDLWHELSSPASFRAISPQILLSLIWRDSIPALCEPRRF